MPDLSLKHIQNQEQSMEKTLCRERFQKGQDLMKAGFVDHAAFGLPVRGLYLPEPEGLICNETGEFAKIIIS